MKIRESFPSRLFDVVNAAMMLLLIAVTLYPIWYAAVASLSSEAMAVSGKVYLWPNQFTWAAYDKVFQEPYLGVSYWNTIRYTVLQTAVTLLLTSLMAYPLAKTNFAPRKIILFLVAFTMLFSGGLIPTYLVVRELGLIDTIWAMVLPTAINTWYLFIMRTFFQALPHELEEAARIDGCGLFQTYWRILLPLSVPVMATIGLYTAVGQWNSFFEALIYLNSKEMYPLQIYLRNIVITGTNVAETAASQTGDLAPTVTLKYAVIMVASLPILSVYPFILQCAA